ncbi:MAG: TonB-dependent receptor [Bacteroidetes bacterium]|nr:TonB-dependent receptor [Bacteroidota bacterium]
MLSGVEACFSQELTQTIRGRILDKDAKSELPGVNIFLLKDSAKVSGAVTDVNGNFRMQNVPVGRYSLRAGFLGYQPYTIPDVIVTSAKEVILNFEMEESAVKVQEVVITATKKGEARNEMATVSARTFSVDETNRYAGSRTDPARMASNFAGVQGTDDSDNEIVVRGNSSLGLLWRLEGVNIPNPNHFAVAGTTSGAVNIINSKTLDNSDFYTGAFPAEYGNAVAGVFDLRMRNGNNEKHEFTGQFGFLGTELAAEGPISKQSGSSYLLTYRYSSLQLFQALHIRIGTSAIPKYQDAAFKFNFPGKHGDNFSVFGVGGKSSINIVVSKDSTPQEDIYGEKNKDQYFGSSMGVIGASYTKTLNEKTFLKFTLAHSTDESWAHHLLVYRDTGYKVDSLIEKMGYEYIQQKTSFVFFASHKFSSRVSMKAGAYIEKYDFDLLDSNRNALTWKFERRNDFIGSTALLQPYVQFKFKPTNKFSFTTGLHAQYFVLNGSSSIEPRAGASWRMKEKQTLSIGFGMHSQMQPTYIYFNRMKDSSGNYFFPNRNIGFTRSIHYVLAYDIFASDNMRVKMETYYQYLYEVPIDTSRSSFSLLNQGTGYGRFFPHTLANKGTGRNYGFELTVEKFFSKSFFYMLTASVFDTKYKGSDGILRSTDFDEKFATNFLFAKEFKVGKKKNSTLTTGTKITWAGGGRYSPADIIKSNQQGEFIELDSMRNAQRFHNYFRWDINIGLKANRKKVTHELGLDLINILNTQNILQLTYDPDPKNPTKNPIREDYQLGFLPLFYYKLDF